MSWWGYVVLLLVAKVLLDAAWEALKNRFRGTDADTRAHNVFARVTIDYQDGEGMATRRSVDVDTFDHRSFGGRCLLRRARRTFLFDRVRSSYDSETGEVIQDLRAHLSGLVGP